MIPPKILSEKELKEYIDQKTGRRRKWILEKIALPYGWKIVGIKLNERPISRSLVGRGSTPISGQIGVMKGICKNKLDKEKAAKLSRTECKGAVRVQPKTHDWVCTTCGFVAEYPASNISWMIKRKYDQDAEKVEVDEENYIIDYPEGEPDPDPTFEEEGKTGSESKVDAGYALKSYENNLKECKKRLMQKGVLEVEYPTEDRRLPRNKKKLQTDHIDRRVLAIAKEKLGRDLKHAIIGRKKIPADFKTGLVQSLRPYLPDLDYHTINNSVNRIIKRYKEKNTTDGSQESIEPQKPNPKKPRYESRNEDYFEKRTSLKEIKRSVQIERLNSRKPAMETIFEGTTEVFQQSSIYPDEVMASNTELKSWMIINQPQVSPKPTA
jgi:hypothetical protein